MTFTDSEAPEAQGTPEIPKEKLLRHLTHTSAMGETYSVLTPSNQKNPHAVQALARNVIPQAHDMILSEKKTDENTMSLTFTNRSNRTKLYLLIKVESYEKIINDLKDVLRKYLQDHRILLHDKEENYTSELSLGTICARFNEYSRIPMVYVNIEDILTIFPKIFTMDEPEFKLSIEEIATDNPRLLTSAQLADIVVSGLPMQELLDHAIHSELSFNPSYNY